MDPATKGLRVISNHLKDQMFDSRTVVEIDSIIVTSIFGQHAKKKPKRTHHMQILAVNLVIDEETKNKVNKTFQERQCDLLFDRPQMYLDTAKEMASYLYRECSPLKRHGGDSKAVIEWCLAAYAMVINEMACIKLSCTAMGPNGVLGFAVHTVKDIPEGHEIRELAGLMPRDGRAKHSELSCINPSSDHNQSERVERVLFGPVRFLNHTCRNPNAEYIAISGTSAFYVLALRDIVAGEELFLDYGPNWFASEPGGCPCESCKPEQQSHKRPVEKQDKAAIEAAKKAAHKAKRQRQKERKAAGKESRAELGLQG